MSYYILPKNINIINLNPKCSNDLPSIYISHSLIQYYESLKQQIIDIFSDNESCSFEHICKLANPYEFIFSQVPGSKFSVSKLKSKNNLFYDLLEITNNLNLFSFVDPLNCLHFLHFTPNYEDSIECFEMFRENCHDNHVFLNKFNENDYTKFDFLFCEMSSGNCFISLVQIIATILKNQKTNGTCIIKISDTFYKPTIDALYLLASFYDRVYISKPNTNNVITFEKYVICKNFFDDKGTNLEETYGKLNAFLNKIGNKYTCSLIDYEVPYYFKNKIDDINIIIGQQQLDALDLILSIYKNKNKNEKIETIKKNSIQISASWCEKYKIPYNKFSEKINIFLPMMNETI